MATHRIPRVTLDEDLRELERRDNERAVSIVYEGETAIVETESITVETRPYFPDFAAKRDAP